MAVAGNPRRCLLGFGVVLFFVGTAAGQATEEEIVVQREWHGNGSTSAAMNEDEQRAQAVVKSSEEWQKLWWKEERHGPPAPEVDFQRQMVIAVFQGVQSSGCYGIEIRRILRGREHLTVEVREIRPSPGAVCTAVLTSPYYMAVIERSELPVRFVNVNAEGELQDLELQRTR